MHMTTIDRLLSYMNKDEKVADSTTASKFDRNQAIEQAIEAIEEGKKLRELYEEREGQHTEQMVLK